MSLISRLRAVVAGDDYLDGELDDFAYDDEPQDHDQRASQAEGGALATINVRYQTPLNRGTGGARRVKSVQSTSHRIPP